MAPRLLTHSLWDLRSDTRSERSLEPTRCERRESSDLAFGHS
jgi:hypothetical protein